MKQKPWFLVILGWLHIIAPFGNFVLNAFLNDRSFSQQLAYWFEVLPPYFTAFYIVIPIIAGIAILLCRRWSYYVFLFCLVAYMISNIYSVMTNPNQAYLIAFVVVSIIDIVLVAYFVVPIVQRVYFDEKIRWWESAERYHVNMKCETQGQSALIRNIAIGGALIEGVSLNFTRDEEISLQAHDEDLELEVRAKVVYADQRTPQKYGLKFMDLSPSQEKSLKKYLQKLATEGKVVKERLPGEGEKFFPWLKRLFTTGKGLLPKLSI